MHNAPTVSYPVGRSHFQAGCLVLLVLIALLTGGCWLAQTRWGWRQGFLGVALGLALVLAVQEWQRTLQGTLAWDGVVWCFTGGAQPTTGQLLVHLDFQFVLLLSLTPPTGQPLWLWAERRQRETLWLALRRAAFSRVSDPSQQSPDDLAAAKLVKSVRP